VRVGSGRACPGSLPHLHLTATAERRPVLGVRGVLAVVVVVPHVVPQRGGARGQCLCLGRCLGGGCCGVAVGLLPGDADDSGGGDHAGHRESRGEGHSVLVVVLWGRGRGGHGRPSRPRPAAPACSPPTLGVSPATPRPAISYIKPLTSGGTSTACSSSTDSGITSSARALVDARTTGAATPSRYASSHRTATTHQRSPARRRGKAYSGTGVIRWLPTDRCCSRNSSVTTVQTACNPMSSSPHEHLPSR